MPDQPEQQPEATPAPEEPPTPRIAQRSKTETIFLICLITFTLLAAGACVVATEYFGIGFPAVIVSLLFGIAIATLTYTYLGGTKGNIFKLGNGIELAGAAAIIIIVFWLVNGPMRDDMKDGQAIAFGRHAQEKVKQANDDLVKAQNERDAAKTAQAKAESRATALENGRSDQQDESVAALVKRIEASSPGDNLADKVLQLEHERKGPWRRELQTLQLSARFNGAVDKGTFRYCQNTHPELADKDVEFEFVDVAASTSQKFQLHAGSDIGAGLCKATKFDVQLGCDAVDGLIKGAASGCDATHGVAWIDPKTGNRVYDLTATVLNSELPH